jgi:uncharacterized protein
LNPALKQERYQILDVLRRFALIGIVTANTVLYSLFLYLPETQFKTVLSTWPNRIADFLELAFIEGKFYTIFSVLFGIGFSILLNRASQESHNFHAWFLKRVFFLFLIGPTHAFFVWPADILATYATCGALLLLFTRAKNRTILICAFVLLLSPIVIYIAGGIHPTFLREIRSALMIHFGFSLENRIQIWASGSYVEMIKLNFCSWFSQIHFIISSSMIFSIMGNFLLGFYLGKNQSYNKLDVYASLIRKLMIVGFLIGIPMNILYAWTFYDESLITKLSATFGIVPLSMAYVCSICLLWLNHGWQKRMLLLAPVGRMALTNYISQSIIFTAIFYRPSLGGKVGPAIYLPIGILVYCAQIFISNYWLKFAEFGPIEWLWRMLTYSKRLPLLRKQHSALIRQDA